jgi:hypothetical protein
VSFRDRLITTLRGARALFEVEGVLVVGSEVPNLLERGAASTLVVSQDVDIAVPVQSHSEVKARLPRLEGLIPSPEEPSVWIPTNSERIELNFIGFDPSERDLSSVRVLEDDTLPLMVFGPLSFLRRGRDVDLGDHLLVPLPRNAGLLMEKLVTDRSGVKGDRDLLVALGLIVVAQAGDVEEFVSMFRSLSRELQEVVRSNLATLSLLPPIAGMPDPTKERARVAALLAQLRVEHRG